ncbi:LysE family transporter [Devosia sp. FJ2-5-3]|uniref:LysE/ArgO family amino acid transporter n=1 Tax=Devosia sp. FJ2-5-3 TaxID=2976680 RepID=UPI0023D8951E|nr:LysE family transporter [Devosia sp. FJ2-5-3]WEJ57830.1 LysE family transporter [Devosia sp. FJ2-5-3]
MTTGESSTIRIGAPTGLALAGIATALALAATSSGWAGGTDGKSFLTGLGLGLAFAASLGPQNLFLIRTGLVRRHMAPVLGAGLASEFTLLLLSAAASGVVAGAFAPIRPALIVLGAGFLLWCGLRQLSQHNQHGIDHVSLKPESHGVAIAHMLIVTWCNPLGYLKWALFAGLLVAQPDIEAKLWCVAGLALASIGKMAIWPLSGRLLGHVLRHKSTVHWFNRISGAALIGSAVLTCTQF